MASGGKRRGYQAKPVQLDGVRNEINVTPLVDVMLVLLIIMMVIGPLLARGKDVPLPHTRNHLEPKDNHEPIVAIDQYGKVFVDKAEVPPGDGQLAGIQDLVQREWAELKATNKKLAGSAGLDRSGENRVLVKVSPEISYGTVYPIIMALHEMNAEAIDLGTEELKE